MALHPLNSFRKYHKVIFAGLTIVCMLTFVMSSGVAGIGDGFSWLQHALGGTSRYPQVAKLYGKNIDIRELTTLREQRILANRYMLMVVLRSHELIVQDVQSILPQLDAQAQMQVRRVVQSREFAFDPRYAQFGAFGQQQYLREAPQFTYPLLILEETLTKANKTAEAQKIRLLRSAVMGDMYLLHDSTTPPPKDELYPNSNLYFGGSTSTEGLLDFKIWQTEADRLGIYLSKDDIDRAVQDEALGRLTNEDGLAIERALTPRTQQVRVNPMPALGEELRVRLAQTTLLGFDPGGIMQVPAPITPDELWQYYRKNRTELAVKLLPIPVSKFIDQVKDKPTEAELTKLFDEYKDVLYHPQRNTPAFKQPRRIKVEWIAAKSDAPRYRNEARKWIMSGIWLQRLAIPGWRWLFSIRLSVNITG